MRVMKRNLITAISLMLLSGCDTFYGISQHSNPFSPVPDMQCVLQETKSIEGVEAVSYSTEEGGRPLTWKGIEKPDVVHRFQYKYKGIESSFYIVEHYNKEASFGHSYGGLNWKPPQENIDLVYPLFNDLEVQLREKCNFKNMQVRNYCSGVKCQSV